MPYIATTGITNSAGIGIVSIDHTDEVVEFDFVNCDSVESHKAKLETNELGLTGFYFFGCFYDLNDFARTNI